MLISYSKYKPFTGGASSFFQMSFSQMQIPQTHFLEHIFPPKNWLGYMLANNFDEN